MTGENQLPATCQDSSKLAVVLSVTAQLLCDSGLIFQKMSEVLQTLLCCQTWATVCPSPLPVLLGGEWCSLAIFVFHPLELQLPLLLLIAFPEDTK